MWFSILFAKLEFVVYLRNFVYSLQEKYDIVQIQTNETKICKYVNFNEMWDNFCFLCAMLDNFRFCLFVCLAPRFPHLHHLPNIPGHRANWAKTNHGSEPTHTEIHWTLLDKKNGRAPEDAASFWFPENMSQKQHQWNEWSWLEHCCALDGGRRYLVSSAVIFPSPFFFSDPHPFWRPSKSERVVFIFVDSFG